MSMLKQVRPARLAVLGIPLMAVVVAVLALAWGHAAPPSAQADDTGPRMALNAAGGGTSCDAPSEPTKCTVPLGGVFTLDIEVVEAPAEGYIGLATHLVYGDLRYNPGSAEEENIWPDNALPVRAPVGRLPGQPPTGTEGFVQHGGLTALTPPFPVSHYVGNVVEFDLTCSADAGSFELALVSFDEDVNRMGAVFSLPDQITKVVPKAVGQRDVDMNGDGTIEEGLDVADTLEINCAEVPPTPTVEGPIATAVGGPTATPGAAGLPPTGTFGGVDADGGVSAGLWAVIGALLAAAAAGLAVFAWRYARDRQVR